MYTQTFVKHVLFNRTYRFIGYSRNSGGKSLGLLWDAKTRIIMDVVHIRFIRVTYKVMPQLPSGKLT